MALFGLNWEESKWPWQFCYIVLYFFASKIGVKLPPGIKVPWHWRGPGRSSASNYHLCPLCVVARSPDVKLDVILTTLTLPSQILSSMQINFQNYTFKSYSVRLSVVLSVGCGCVKAVVMISGPIVTQSPGARQHQTRHSGHSRDSLLLPNYSSSAQPPHNSHHCPQLKTKLYALQILFQGVNCTINKAEKLMNLLQSVWFLQTVVYWLFWNVEI